MISREFVLAGRAIFTVSNGKGRHYTYRVTMGKLRSFVSILNGSDNTWNYVNIAMLNPDTGELVGQYGDDIRIKVLRWALRKIWSQSSLPHGYAIQHAGKCGRCGRLLTTPQSLESGLGPECKKETVKV